MTLSRIVFALMAFSLVAACGAGGSGSADNSAIIGLTVDNTVSPTQLVIANADNQTIQMVNLSNGALTLLAGAANTSGAVDDTGSAARFNEPFGIALSGTDFFVADTFNHAIRKITSAGVTTTLAGAIGKSGMTDGAGASALFFGPKSLVSDGTNLYIADTSNHNLRKLVIGTGATTTLAGGGSAGAVDGTGSSARFSAPFGVAYDGTHIYLTDTGNQTVRKITSAGVVTTLAGTSGAAGVTDATGTTAKFNTPTGLVYFNDPSLGGVLFVADSSNHTIRKIVIASGVVTTLAGSAGASGSADGTGSAARFNTPIGLTVDNAGNLYVSDQNYKKIRKVVVSTGAVTTLSVAF